MKLVGIDIQEVVKGTPEIELLLPVGTLSYLYHLTGEFVFLQGCLLWFLPSAVALTGVAEFSRLNDSDRSSERAKIRSLMYLPFVIVTKLLGGVTAIIAGWNNLVPNKHTIWFFSSMRSPESFSIYPRIFESYIASSDLILLILVMLLIWPLLRAFVRVLMQIAVRRLDRFRIYLRYR